MFFGRLFGKKKTILEKAKERFPNAESDLVAFLQLKMENCTQCLAESVTGGKIENEEEK